jgi:hypothetical protein
MGRVHGRRAPPPDMMAAQAQSSVELNKIKEEEG